MINRTTNTNTPSTDWTFLIHEINEQTKRSERRLTIAIELAILTLAGLAVWALVVAVMEMTL